MTTGRFSRPIELGLIGLAALVAVAVFAGTTEASAANTGRTTTTTRSASSAIAADFTSIFKGENASLANSGWSGCAAPVTWSVDTSELNADQAAIAIRQIGWAFDQWSAASGLTFAFSGQVPVSYTDAGYAVRPANGSAAADRHIYLTFLRIGEASPLKSNIYGFGAPAKFVTSNKEIVGGYAVFRTDHVATTGAKSPRKTKSLYLHELGHVLGLSHASLVENIMFPIVTNRTRLGAGDVNGVHVMTKTCAAS
jgi:hypothetical protein